MRPLRATNPCALHPAHAVQSFRSDGFEVYESADEVGSRHKRIYKGHFIRKPDPFDAHFHTQNCLEACQRAKVREAHFAQ